MSKRLNLKHIPLIILIGMLLAGGSLLIANTVSGGTETWRFPICEGEIPVGGPNECPIQTVTFTRYGWPYTTKSITGYQDGTTKINNGTMANKAPFPFNLWYGSFLNWVMFTLGFTAIGLSLMLYKSRR